MTPEGPLVPLRAHQGEVLGPIMRLMFHTCGGRGALPGDGPVILAGNHLRSSTR
ncbi:hypothetical protein ACRAWF_24220 [Streptomyces sp. L7]